MASTSSSSCVSNSQHPRWNVFLSFRGEDTRRGFTGHLYKALSDRGIYTFMDDTRLKHGAPISKELLKAIEQSQVALIIFSVNYASSTWCLDELVKIMECEKINQSGESSVIPIFYDVDPSTVRKQKESFAKALEEHESRFKVNDDVEGMQKVQRWRTALTAAANLGGYDIRQGIEANWIEHIVNQISSRVWKTSLSSLQNIVGISTHLEKVKSLLQVEIDDVRIVGICGMGGIGKTTIASAVFDTLSDQYEAASFLLDVKENKVGLHDLQNILLSELLGEKDNFVNNKEAGKKLMSERLRSKKVLIVLDDIDDTDDYVDYLAGGLDWFGSGSRIIVTTRDRDLIGKSKVYEVKAMDVEKAVRLFNQHAFKEEHPDGSFKDLTLEVISHASGLPLALKVLGRHLHNKDINEWRSAIAKMRKNMNSKIVDKLKISYDGLDPVEKKMFLDLACFFRGKERNWIKPILESCDFEVEIGLRVLIDKYLVFISDKDTIEMHDLIQEMGKHVVNMQREPGERSRLWLYEDIKEVLKNNTGTKAVEAIWLEGIPLLSSPCFFSNEALINMRSLRILGLPSVWRTLDGSIGCLPNSLRWFNYFCYPWESLPETFEPEKLVHLELTCSNLRFLWTGIKDLPYLRKLNLSQSRRLKQTPDFTGMPNLEKLNLSLCSNLEEISSSLGCCRKLIRLRLRHCSKLESLPEEIGDLEKLELLDACDTAISQPPSSIVRLNNLTFLNFSGSRLREFPPVGEGLHSLEYLNLRNCNLIDGGLPEDIGCLSSLKKVTLRGNKFEHLPRSIAQLGALQHLDLRDCKMLKELPELPPELKELGANSDVILENIHSLGTKQILTVDDVCVDNSFYNRLACALYQNFSSKQHDIFASDYLSESVFSISLCGFCRFKPRKIPSWFHYHGEDTSVLVDLPKNWYIHDNFLGFAVCYEGISVEATIHLIPLCDDDEMSWMTQKLALHNYSRPCIYLELALHFFFVPLAVLWDTSKANGKRPNDCGHIRLYFSGEMKMYGFRLLYKDELEGAKKEKEKKEDELEGESLLQMMENNEEPTKHCIGIRRNSYENNELDGEASCSNFKKQR